MQKGSLFLVPSGGLANRMRAIASAYALTQDVDSRLQVIWFEDWGMKAAFTDIFKPVAQLPIREATLTDKLLYDRARRRNLWLTDLPQRLLFECRIHDKQIWQLKQQGFDFNVWAKGHRCYMSSYHALISFPDSIYRELFQPIKEVMGVVDVFRNQFSPHTIGLHIRRTDNIESIAKSPDRLFVEKLEGEIEVHDDTKVFLATDNDEVKQSFCKRFGGRIITPTATANRNSIEGIRGGLVDMYTLAATGKIYGSAGSSFSEMAAKIGGCELEIVSL